MSTTTTPDPPLRVMALHALAYCERLFYLEEVEELRVADARVHAGRRLHTSLERDEDEALESFTLSSDALGICGKVDVLRRRDGVMIPYEHKRGRSKRGDDGPEAWESDRLQAIAYGHLVAEGLGEVVEEVRVRYHADNKLVRIPIGDATRAELLDAVAHARTLQASLDRPPVTDTPRRCTHCSLAPVCLPEEERLIDDPAHDTIRLFPPRRDRQTLHVTEAGTRLGKSGDELVVKKRDGGRTRVPMRTIDQVVLHGYVQVSTQALHACHYHGVGVHFMTGGGRHVGSVQPGKSQVQRRHRQFEAMQRDSVTLELSRRLVEAKVHAQLRFLLRTTRGEERDLEVEAALTEIRKALRLLDSATTADELRGHEGFAARHYFAGLACVLRDRAEPPFRITGRNRRPPRDRTNCLLSFSYNLLYKAATAACIAAGLEPSFGFFHRPRSAAYPLALDLQELFRVSMVDMPILGALARRAFHPDDDFTLAGDHVWLTSSGRAKAISLFERRKQDTWKHPVIGYSLSYDRLIELEARLLEKEWTGKPGLFARMRLR